ncbi:MAG: nucleotide exchange factor GrpE [Desulfobacterales bacterium]
MSKEKQSSIQKDESQEREGPELEPLDREAAERTEASGKAGEMTTPADERLPDSEASDRPAGIDADETPTGDEPLDIRLRNAESEAEKNYELFLRVSAESENFKKRTQREFEDFRKYANQALVKDLLIVVDNLERALESCRNENGSSSQLMEGVDLTLKEILKVLEKYGVKPIEALEKPFDPAMHEAVMQEDVEDVPGNTVVREFQKGYWMHDRLLRPSMVAVSKP